MSLFESFGGRETIDTPEEIKDLEDNVVDSFINYFNNEINKLGFTAQEIETIGITRDLVQQSLQHQNIWELIADRVSTLSSNTEENKIPDKEHTKENNINKITLLRLKREQELSALNNNLNNKSTLGTAASFYAKLGGDQLRQTQGATNTSSEIQNHSEQTDLTTTTNEDTGNNQQPRQQQNNFEQGNSHVDSSAVIDYARTFLGKPYMSSIQGYGEQVRGLDCSGLISQGLRHMGIIKPQEYLWVPSLCRENKHLGEDNGHHTVGTSIDTLTGQRFDIKSKQIDKAKAGDWLFWYSQQAQYSRCGGLHHVAMIQETKEVHGVTMYKIIESNGLEGVVEKRVNPIQYCAGAGGSTPVIQTPDYQQIQQIHNPSAVQTA